MTLLGKKEFLFHYEKLDLTAFAFDKGVVIIIMPKSLHGV